MKYYILEGNMKPDVPQGPEFKATVKKTETGRAKNRNDYRTTVWA